MGMPTHSLSTVREGDAAFDSPFPIAMKINGAPALPAKRAKDRGVSVV